jgi:hypothetical protein
MANVNSRAARRWRQMGAALLLMSAGATMNADVPKFDGRGWVVGHQQRDGQRSIIEYVLPGQNVENWKELVTSSVFPQPVPVAPFVEELHASLAQGCPSLVWTVVKQDEKTAIVEWRDAGCGGFEPTSELMRVTIEKDGLFRLAYSVKGRLTPERRKTWLAILGQAPLAERAARDSARETKSAAEDAEQAVRMAKVTQVLAGFVRQNGRPCAAPARAELKEQIPGPQGPLSEWLLECSDARYTLLAQPSGAMTVIQHPGQD